jgi:aspartyl-tRNA(Asn)/glutamyl-tRNA(Gln) amidotransferase subunit A
MNATDLCFTPATELARLIREKALSPVELTRALLERIEALQPTLNAYCTLLADEALEAARAAEQAVMDGRPLGPLHGVGASIKDLTMMKGVPWMAGSRIFAERVPTEDAPAVTRLREAGAIVLGKTTTPEFGWKALSDGPLTGATHNPWRLELTTGGSSAGAAASVAAGMGPLAQGSDGAGSIRVPSAFCGIYGIKPSFGRVPNYPLSNNDNATHLGPLTRTVADAALMLSVLAGPSELDRTSLEAPPADYVGRLHEGIRGLKVGYSPDLGSLRVDPEVADVVRRAVGAFEELGAHVEEVNPGFGDGEELATMLWNAHEAGNYAPHLRQWELEMDPGLVASIRDGLRYSVVDYIALRGRKILYWDAVRSFFERYDLLLTPTVSVAPFPLFRLQPEHWPQHPWNWMTWAGFSYPFNLTGNPAASCPAGMTPDGLPVGLQIVGRRFADVTVLQASAAFEQARPWAGQRPPL